MTQPKRQWARLLELAQLDDMRMHDLRRSLGSWLAMSGHSLPMIGRALGHRDIGSTQVYARMQLEPVAEAVAQAQELMFKPRGAKVTSLRKRGRR